MRSEQVQPRVRCSQLYDQLEPLNMNCYAPRAGYYTLLSKTRVLFEDGVVDAAWALWAPENNYYYKETFLVKVQLKSFERNPIPGAEHLLKDNFVGKTIHVRSAQRCNDGRGKFIVDWEISPKKGQSEILAELNQMRDSTEFAHKWLFSIDELKSKIDDNKYFY